MFFSVTKNFFLNEASNLHFSDAYYYNIVSSRQNICLTTAFNDYPIILWCNRIGKKIRKCDVGKIEAIRANSARLPKTPQPESP